MSDPDEPVLPPEDGLVRLRLDLAYDGTDFSGWALQPGLRTVQGEIEAALRTLFRTGRVRMVVAGRTDTGVHAAGQVAHCEVGASSWLIERDRIVRRLAGLLPGDVRIYRMTEVSKDFDARFSALWRRYRYRICDSDSGPDPLRRHDTVGWKHRLDARAMHEAAQLLLGLNDYVAFCRRRAGASTVRQLQRLDVRRSGSEIEIEVEADAFCHSMVRSLVGSIASVGDGSRPVEWPATLLKTDRRSDEVTVAPARGLTLLEIGYPDPAEFGVRASETRAVRTIADPPD